MYKLYWRCNGGHYFNTVRCPFDGWTSKELAELNQVAEEFRSMKTDPSIGAMKNAGVSDEALRRAIVVEFGNDRSVFDAISPDYYVVDGKSVKLHKTGLDFH